MPELKVPFALAPDGALVHIDVSDPAAKYTCPGCGARVGRRGGSKRLHFFHVGAAPCSPESVLHKVGKLLVLQAVGDWKAGRTGPPIVVHRCRNHERCANEMSGPLPDRIQEAREEVRVENRWIVDVALLSNGEPVAAVEVVHTHEADAAKVAGMKLKFVEVDAVDLLIDATTWRSRAADKECDPCRTSRVQAEKAAAEWAERQKRDAAEAAERVVSDPPKAWAMLEAKGVDTTRMRTRFEARLHKCHRCGRRVPVFSWGAERKGYPGQPAPPTLVWAPVKRPGGKGRPEWTDTCINCEVHLHPFYVWEGGW